VNIVALCVICPDCDRLMDVTQDGNAWRIKPHAPRFERGDVTLGDKLCPASDRLLNTDGSEATTARLVESASAILDWLRSYTGPRDAGGIHERTVNLFNALAPFGYNPATRPKQEE
jgi:hypothetical protein